MNKPKLHLTIQKNTKLICICICILCMLVFSCRTIDTSDTKDDQIENLEKEKKRLLWEKEQERLKKEKQAQKERIEELKRLQLLEEKRKKEESLERQRKEQKRLEALEKKRKKEEELKKVALKKKKRILLKLQNLKYVDAFWFQEDQQLLYSTINIMANTKKYSTQALYHNKNPLQFHSFSRKNVSSLYDLKKIRALEKNSFDISNLILKQKGHYILLQSQQNDNVQSYQPLQIKLQDKIFFIIDIYSDGEDLIFMDLESIDGNLLYRRILVHKVFLKYF